MNLLNQFKPGLSSPLTFSIVNTSTFTQEITSSSPTNRILPPNFLLSLSYRPHDNTVLNLLSTKKKRITVSDSLTGDDDAREQAATSTNATSDLGSADVFASLVLSTGVLYLQPSQARYYPLLPSGIEPNQLHNIVFMVSNGSISSCVDGVFLGGNPSVVLWDADGGVGTTVAFSEHLYSVQQLVSCISPTVEPQYNGRIPLQQTTQLNEHLRKTHCHEYHYQCICCPLLFW